MSTTRSVTQAASVFGLSDWEAWLDRLSFRLFGMSGEEFAAAYRSGDIQHGGSADDLASVLPLIDRLRKNQRAGG